MAPFQLREGRAEVLEQSGAAAPEVREQRTRRAQPYAAPRALEQHRAELRFERADLLRHRRLGEPEALRRRADTAEPRDGEKAPQRSAEKIHSHDSWLH